MKFNKHQKEIITAINDGRICDILSFVTAFKNYKIYKNDKDLIKLRFISQEKDQLYPVSVIDPLQSGDCQTEYEHASLTLNASVEIQYNNDRFSYDLFDENGICIMNSFDEVKGFIAIWEFLKKELYVLETSKETNPKELSLFFQEKENPHKNQSVCDFKDTTIMGEEFVPARYKYGFDTTTSGEIKTIETPKIPVHNVNAISFIDTILECNTDNMNICSSYLNKRILSTPTLKEFIKNDFMTIDQKNAKKSLIAAWIAIFIAIIVGVFSIYSTYNIDPSDGNLKDVIIHLEKIEQLINNH